MKRLSLALISLAAAGVSIAQTGQTGSISVDARSNIFGYGVTTPGAGGAGLLAPTIGLDPGVGRMLTFSASGSANWGNQWPFYGPDGGPNGPLGPRDTNLTGVGPISGYAAPWHGHLVGLFIEAGDISALTAPSSIVYSSLADFANPTYTPGLRQVFFIGDGLTGTGSGSSQVFNVPDGAAKLVLGIADGFDFTGAPGYYSDNTGSFNVSYQSVPEPTSVCAMALGLAALVRRRRR